MPAYLIVTPLEYRLDAPMQQAGRGRDAAARGRRARRSRGPGSPSTRASRAGARRPMRSSASGRPSASTASSPRLPPGAARLHAEGAAVDPHARTERDGHPAARSDAGRGSSAGARARGRRLELGGASAVEALLEAPPQIVTGEPRQRARGRRWGGRHVHLSTSGAVKPGVGVFLGEHGQRRLAPKSLEEPGEKAHRAGLPRQVCGS